MFLLRVPDDNPQAALDEIRDADPYYQAGVAQYELLPWNVVIGKEDLDKLKNRGLSDEVTARLEL